MRNRVLLAIVLFSPFLSMGQSRKEMPKTKIRPVAITIDSALFRPNSFWIDPPKDLELFFSDLKGLEHHNVYLHAGDAKIPIEGPCVLYLNGIGSRMVYPGDHLAIKFNEDQSSVIFYAPGNKNRSMDLAVIAILVDSGYVWWRNAYNRFKDQEVNSAVDFVQFEQQYLSETVALSQRKRVIADSLLLSYDAGKNVRDYINNKIIDDSLNAIISFLEQYQKEYIRYELMQKRVMTLANVLSSFWQDESVRYNTTAVNRLFDIILHSRKIGTVVRTQELFYEQRKTMDSFFTGYPKAFLWSTALYTCAKMHITLPAEEIDLYKQDTYNTEYRSMVESRLVMNEKFNKVVVKPGISRVTGLASNKPTTIEAVLRKYKGSPVLIDFWASWCSPCRQELPSSIALEKELNGKVKFIYVSFDASFTNWVRASNIEQIDPENSYLFVDANKSDFFNRFKINTIPRYLLFGKNGTIINDNAPRPSEAKLKSLIEENFLSKKISP